MSDFSEKVIKKDYEDDEEYFKKPEPMFFTSNDLFFPMMIMTIIVALAFFWLGTITEKSEAIKAGAAEVIDGKFTYKNPLN